MGTAEQHQQQLTNDLLLDAGNGTFFGSSSSSQSFYNGIDSNWSGSSIDVIIFRFYPKTDIDSMIIFPEKFSQAFPRLVNNCQVHKKSTFNIELSNPTKIMAHRIKTREKILEKSMLDILLKDPRLGTEK